ncbi:Putative ATP:guanido phosphotransferase [Jeotgalicoccus aerolatus]|uniref:Protein arginine kinase n=1 Tax=Jeotgalicoccus aerolatus TaxID=709510 RepID=A0A1G9B399_9STAP|nr:protein arginine kinase [Jeotgalicoccus aerolatus]MBP1952011.1 protein arginine kinase [Jeotgalicoccus aerolatus]NMA80750.1 protein arginine kinase [Jeotgalicoccus aerolatus]CAD2071292.1 Putative ATP:guanido phosphotransferase [Jeotgalicoccus aerolatus]SDK33948.1 protein arginine kinase [Jeotgalicoccus aerolatus]GGE05238.1 protein-arginine kinase [Jeotgalicoccus aerolatus]
MNRQTSMWIKNAENTEIEMSSRIRLARNIKGVPFTHMLEDDEDLEALGGLVSKMIPDYDLALLENMTGLERALLAEKHLISPNFARNGTRVFINEDEDMSIMLGEEDHLRIQALGTNVSLEALYEKATAVDDTLEQKIEYAFDEQYGYLTACPTNVGTGMRASVMLHLPALTATNKIQRFHNNLARFGFTLRGIYGEGSESLGSVYQLSNQVTLGFEEAVIINNLSELKNRLIEEERLARQHMMTLDTLDAVNRSLGILRHAYKLSLKEAAMHLSNVKLGIDLSYIDLDGFNFQEWFQLIQPGFVKERLTEEGNHDDTRTAAESTRAALTRELLGGE